MCKIVIYCKDDCPQCDLLKIYFEGHTKITYKNLGVDFTREEVKTIYPSIKSYPLVIFQGGIIEKKDYGKLLHFMKTTPTWYLLPR
ncbi:MAG: hypothetical protein ACI9YE_000469 [Psychroserpens sp.]|jgi:hypothetical protein